MRARLRVYPTRYSCPSEHQELVEFLTGQFAQINRQFTQVDQQLRRIEAALADESGRREILGRDLVALKEHVSALQARIADIECRLDS